MHLSQESLYGIDAMVALARRDPAEPAGVREVARARGLPENFLAKILQKLARAGLLTSSRGRRRGYALGAPAAQITLVEILEAIEGTGCLGRCLFWPRRCGVDAPCHLHHEVGVEIRAGLQGRLKALTLADLASGRRH